MVAVESAHNHGFSPTGCIDAAANARANAKPGPSERPIPDLLVANLATRRVVRQSSRCADQRGVLFWHERGYDAGADGTATSRLPIV
jgi:hypothetical protein